MPSGIAQDTWITSMEIRPSEPAVTHHMCVYFKPHTADVVYNKPYWYDRQRDDAGAAVEADAGVNGKGIPQSVTAGSNGIEGCYVPGHRTQDYRIHNAAKLIKAGTDIVFQLHYTPNGKDVTDRPRLGLTLAKAPHMHVRGKEMTYKLIYPDGRTETILSVPHYDFNWQLGYDLAQPIHVPKGTRLAVTAHYDNSVNNKFNPDPNRTVYYGDMTWEEMMFPFYSVVVDRGVDPRKVVKIVRGRESNGT